MTLSLYISNLTPTLTHGIDTTAIGILANLGYIIGNSRVQKKLQQELDQAYKSLGLDAEARDFTFKEVEKLPYLSAVITESTRLHPSIQYQLPRYVPPEGVQLGPYFIKKGTICGISPRSMNRSKEIFGPDADVFRPERWIAQCLGDEERIKQQSLLLTTVSIPGSALSGHLR